MPVGVVPPKKSWPAPNAPSARLLDDALPLGERLYAERPKAFGKRLEVYWRAKKR
jgi:hypothetical protein